MKEKIEYYRHYKKFMEMKLEQSMAKTPEYQVFANRYPHIAESIRIKRKIERLKKKLKSEKERTSRFQIKKEINTARIRLRMRGARPQDTVFHTHFMLHACTQALRKKYIGIQKKLRGILPPSIIDLKSLDTVERGLAVREWIQNRMHACKKRLASKNLH